MDAWIGPFILVYGTCSVFVLRVIVIEIIANEYMSAFEKAWRSVLSFVLWPALLGLVFLKAAYLFFLKGWYPQ